MTRINIIDPTLLADQHLVAEYRETAMVPAALRRTLKSARGYSVSRIPATFTLNSGHVTFFYNKMQYICDRYQSLISEMKRRGMSPDPSRVLILDDIPQKCFGDWVPTPSEQRVIVDRISLRLRQRGDWYRYCGTSVNVEELIQRMEKYVDV